MKALHNLRERDDVIIAPADKGNATVVMDSIEYERKALDVISKKPLELVKNDPTKKIEATLNKHLWKLCQSRFISKP